MKKTPINFEKAELRMDLGMSSILRWGLALAAAIVVCGAAIYLVRHGGEPPHYQVFRKAAKEYRTVRGILDQVGEGRGRGIIMLGIGLLLLTPLARVAFALVSFAEERDYTYIIVSVVVLLVLLFSLLAG